MPCIFAWWGQHCLLVVLRYYCLLYVGMGVHCTGGTCGCNMHTSLVLLTVCTVSLCCTYNHTESTHH